MLNSLQVTLQAKLVYQPGGRAVDLEHRDQCGREGDSFLHRSVTQFWSTVDICWRRESMSWLDPKGEDRLLICLETSAGEALVQSRWDRTQKGKTGWYGFTYFCINQADYSLTSCYPTVQSTGYLFSVVDWQRKNREGNFHKDPAKTLPCN